jgi:uncharacterized membrane protein
MRRIHLRPLGSLISDQKASVTILTAGGLLMMISAAALAVDVGSLYLGKRRLQGVADAAALASATAITDPGPGANAAIQANSDGNARVQSLTPGVYSADASIAVAQRFAAGGSSPNAIRVVLVKDAPLFFGRFLTGHATTEISARATATRMDMAAFSIGSRLAAVQGGLPNALLSGLAGTTLNVSVMDYNALVGANVDILAFSDALRTQAHLNAATFGDTLNSRVTLPQALSALAAVTGDPTAAAALRSMALKVPATTIRLSDLIDLGPLGDLNRVDASKPISVDSYAVAREMLELANGQRQVALDLGLAVPGIASSRLTLAIGQRPSHSPWLAVDSDGSTIVRTAQSRLYLDTTLAGAATLGLVSVRLPVYVELAQAQAKLSAISCPYGASRARVTLDVMPAVGEISIADIDTGTLGDFTAPVTKRRALIAHAVLIDVTGQSSVTLGGVNWQSVTFSPDDIAAHRPLTVSTNDIAQGVATSLIGRIDLRATALGLGLNLSSVTATVGGALNVAAPALDGVVDQVTNLLGVHVGQADTWIDGVRCGTPALVG